MNEAATVSARRASAADDCQARGDTREIAFVTLAVAARVALAGDACASGDRILNSDADIWKYSAFHVDAAVGAVATADRRRRCGGALDVAFTGIASARVDVDRVDRAILHGGWGDRASGGELRRTRPSCLDIDC